MADSPQLRKRNTSGDLPPPRTSKPLKPVSPPLSNTRLSRLIYLLILLTALLSAYYSYRVVQIKKEAGGWWNMALGRRSSMSMGHDEASSTSFSHIRRGKAAAASTHDDGESVEDKINALARALGMPSKDLASAIAVAVREYVPPASLSSIAGKASGTAVSAMLQEGKEGKSAQADSQSTGIIGDVVGGMDTFVGMDEPV